MILVLHRVDDSHCLIARVGEERGGEEGDSEKSVEQGREEPAHQHEHALLQPLQHDLVHQLVENDETLQEQEGEGGEEEEDVERDDEGAGGGEETDGCNDVAETEADLEANLCYIIRVQTTEMGKLENFELRVSREHSLHSSINILGYCATIKIKQ